MVGSAGFAVEEGALSLDAPAIAGELAVAADDAVAGMATASALAAQAPATARTARGLPMRVAISV